MDIEYFREYALKKENSLECTPFGDDILVYKTGGKIFMMMNFNVPPEISLKCNPEYAVELREKYNSVMPAYHMNKKHWNMIILDGEVSSRETLKMIDHSYELIKKHLKKEKQK